MAKASGRLINKPTSAHEIAWGGLPHFFLNTSFLTSGQNSMNALLPLFPSTPYRQRRAAWPASASLSARHVLERKLFPTFPAKRAYAGRKRVAQVFTPNRPQRSLHRIARRNPGQPHAIAFPKSSPVWTVLLGRVSRCPQGGAQGSIKKQAARSYRGFHEPLEALRPRDRLVIGQRMAGQTDLLCNAGFLRTCRLRRRRQPHEQRQRQSHDQLQHGFSLFDIENGTHRKPIWPACDLVSTIFILGTPECHPHQHCGNTRKRIWLCCWVAKFATSSMLPGSVSRFIR